MQRLVVFRYVGPANFLLCALLSFFFQVKVLHFALPVLKKYLPRVSLFDWADFFGWDEIEQLRNDAVAVWLKKNQGIGKIPTRLNVTGTGIDCDAKIRQFLGLIFEEWYILGKLADRKKRAIIIGDAEIRVLQKSVAGLSRNSGGLVLTSLNRFNLILTQMERVFYFIMVNLRWAVTCFRKIIKAGGSSPVYPVVWDAVNFNEFYSGKDKRSFPWILGCSAVSKRDVLFLLPQNPPPRLRSWLADEQINWIRDKGELLCYLSRGDLVRIAWLCLLTVPRLLLRLFQFSARENVLFWYPELLIWKKVALQLQVKTYVSSCSTVGNAKPRILILNELGVETVMYYYSANAYNFSKSKTKLLKMAHTVYLHRVVTAWHNDIVNYLSMHQKDVKTLVTGGLFIKGHGQKLLVKFNEEYDDSQ